MGAKSSLFDRPRRSGIATHPKARCRRCYHDVGPGWMGTDLMNIAIDIDRGCQVKPESVDRGTPPTWTLARSTAPSQVAAMERIPRGGPIRLPSMIADPAYHLSRPATVSKPVRYCCEPSGSTRRIRASSVPTKTTSPIGMQHESSNSLFAIAVHSPSEDRR